MVGPKTEPEPAARPGESPKRRVIEEIVVTAQKREQALEAVPISMSVIDDRFIAEEAITDLRDAMLFVPNVQVTPGLLYGGTPRCRGFSIDTRNRAFEPPCSLALDGVPYTAFQYFQAALFDVQRIEVLRGPQGTTFGKNTTAGLIHLITKDPTDELTGHVDVQFGQLDHRRLEAAIGGPVLPGFLNFRAAGISDSQEGYMKNTTADIVPGAVKRPRDRDREGFRLKLGFPDLFGSNLKLSYEDVTLESRGAGFEIFDVSPSVASFIRGYDPNADFERANLVVSEDFPTETSLKIRTFQADWSYGLLGWSLDAVAARSALDVVQNNDVDLTPVPASYLLRDESYPTTTFELRTLSPSLPGLYGLEELFGWNLGRSELLAGLFYQRRTSNIGFFQVLRDGPLLGLTAAAQGGSAPGTGFLPAPPPETSLDEAVLEESFDLRLDQDADAVAGFAELQWHFAERWALQYGMRLSNETKDGTRAGRLSDPSPVFRAAVNARDYTERESPSEFHFQPKVSLNHEPFDGMSLFAHWTRGFKAGGLNLFSYTGGDFSYDAEIATEWGIDVKTAFLGGAARLNVSLFRLDLDDFQVLTSEPQAVFPAFVVRNAAEARAQGVEADFMILPNDWLTLIGTVGLNDTEFIDFPINACPPDRENTDGDDDPRCDVSGMPFPFAPKWSNTLTTRIRHPLAGLPGWNGLRSLSVAGIDLGGVELMAGFTVEFVDVHFVQSTLDPRLRQPSFFRLRANLGLGNTLQGWSFRVTGTNLTDERVLQDSIPILPNIFHAVTEPPRIVVGQFRWEF